MQAPHGAPEPERVQLPGEREGRRSRSLRKALLLSLIVHVAILLIVYLIARRIPLPDALKPRTQEQESMPVIFTPQRAAIIEKVAPDTNVIGADNAIARSPGPEPPSPAGRLENPDPTAGLRGRPRPPAPDEAPEPATEPDEESARRPDSRTETIDDKRRRVAAALGSLGSFGDPGQGGEGDSSGSPSSGIGFKFGGGAMQIESTSNVDWGPWVQRVHREVKENWHSIIPVAARVGMKGVVVVHFRVQRDGTITEFENRESAGVPPLDQAVKDALLVMSSPLPPLPLPDDSDEESIGVTYTFIYNLDDEREMRAWRRLNWQKKRAEQGG